MLYIISKKAYRIRSDHVPSWSDAEFEAPDLYVVSASWLFALFY